MSEHLHEVDGTPIGDFARYISRVREDTEPSRFGTTEVFEEVSYRNASDNRSLPLRSVKLIQGTIRGLHIEAAWLNVDLLKCDLSHLRGTMHLSEVRAERSNLQHLIANVFGTFSCFTRCKFDRALLKRPVFMNCRFESCSFKSAVFVDPLFVDCRFIGVDLTNSRWENPLRLSIRGTWKSAELAKDSSKDAIEYFASHGAKTGD